MTRIAAGACWRCRSPARVRFHARDLNRRTAGDFAYRGCASCGLLFIDPVPADPATAYGAGYPAYQPRSDTELADLADRESYKLGFIPAGPPGRRLLEIGPATGGFCLAAKRAGFAVEAIEMDADCCRVLREVVGVRAIHSADPVAALREVGAYDVIALWHVVEHLPDPFATLSAAAARLTPDGALIVATPNPDSLQFRRFGRRWAHLDAPRHLCLVPSALLISALAEAGLTLVRIATADPGGVRLDRTGWQASLGHYASARLAKKVLHGLGLAVAWAVAPYERRGLRGSGYTAVFRRPDIVGG